MDQLFYIHRIAKRIRGSNYLQEYYEVEGLREGEPLIFFDEETNKWFSVTKVPDGVLLQDVMPQKPVFENPREFATWDEALKAAPQCARVMPKGLF
jgi:hypothetical protein